MKSIRMNVLSQKILINLYHISNTNQLFFAVWILTISIRYINLIRLSASTGFFNQISNILVCSYIQMEITTPWKTNHGPDHLKIAEGKVDQELRSPKVRSVNYTRGLSGQGKRFLDRYKKMVDLISNYQASVSGEDSTSSKISQSRL